MAAMADGVGRRKFDSPAKLVGGNDGRRRWPSYFHSLRYAALREVLSICTGAMRASGALVGVLGFSGGTKSFSAKRIWDFLPHVKQITGRNPNTENNRSRPLRRRRQRA
jgi:hypothetical protein